MKRKQTKPSGNRLTVTAEGLRKILDLLGDELRGGADGFVTATVFPDGGVLVKTKDGRSLLNDDLEIYLEGDRE
jgi:hypothetical protein